MAGGTIHMDAKRAPDTILPAVLLQSPAAVEGPDSCASLFAPVHTKNSTNERTCGLWSNVCLLQKDTLLSSLSPYLSSSPACPSKLKPKNYLAAIQIRPAKRVGLAAKTYVKMKPLFWNLITKSRTQVLQSQSDVCQTTDKDVPLTPIFLVCALASNKFVCVASKQGFSWVRPTANDFSIRMNLCVAACCSVSWRY